MQLIFPDDPAWSMTFPHRVSPRQDEWLPGLLLRCDEANHWAGGTTVAHLLRAVYRHPAANRLNVIDPLPIHLGYLSEVLAVSPHAIFATTYLSEMERLSGIERRYPRVYRLLLQTNISFRFSLCPECVADGRTLLRSLMLPHLTICQEHHLVLQTVCRCGTKLRLFPRTISPFTCYACGLDWGKLLRIKALPESIALERQILSCYTWFFSQGTPELLISVLHRIEEYEMENDKQGSFLSKKGKPSQPINRPYSRGILVLGDVVSSLMRLNLPLHEIMKDTNHFSGNVPKYS